MASFLTILKDIEHGAEKVGFFLAQLGVEAAPVVSVLNPAAGSILQLVSGLVIEAEVKIKGENMGAARKQLVMNNLQAEMTLAYASKNQQVPSGVMSELSSTADNIVTLLNAVAQTTAANKA